MSKKMISVEKYYQVLGLILLAKEKMKEIYNIEKNLANILEIENDGMDYYGHVSDAIYSGYTANELLMHLDIEVEEDSKK